MKPLWRSIIFCSGLLLAVTTPVMAETASKRHAFPNVPTPVLSSEAKSVPNQSSEYQNAYAQGEREAQENIAKGEPSIYTFGKPGGSGIDQQTGFPLVAIAGCVIDDSILGRSNGYNDTMREWAAAQAIVNSSKPALP